MQAGTLSRGPLAATAVAVAAARHGNGVQVDVVDGAQLRGEIEDRGGEPGAAEVAAGEEAVELGQKPRRTLAQRPDAALESRLVA